MIDHHFFLLGGLSLFLAHDHHERGERGFAAAFGILGALHLFAFFGKAILA